MVHTPLNMAVSIGPGVDIHVLVITAHTRERSVIANAVVVFAPHFILIYILTLRLVSVLTILVNRPVVVQVVVQKYLNIPP